MKPMSELLKPVTFRGIFTIADVSPTTYFDSLFSADQHTIQQGIIGTSDKRKGLWWLE